MLKIDQLSEDIFTSIAISFLEWSFLLWRERLFFIITCSRKSRIFITWVMILRNIIIALTQMKGIRISGTLVWWRLLEKTFNLKFRLTQRFRSDTHLSEMLFHVFRYLIHSVRHIWRGWGLTTATITSVWIALGLSNLFVRFFVRV